MCNIGCVKALMVLFIEYKSLAHGFNRHLWIHIFVLIFAVFSIILLAKYYYDVYLLYAAYLNQKEIEKQFEPMDKELSMTRIITEKNRRDSEYLLSKEQVQIFPKSEKDIIIFWSSFVTVKENDKKISNTGKNENKDSHEWVDKWSILLLIGNWLQIIGTTVYLLDFQQKPEVHNVIMGLGCFFALAYLISYLRINNEYYLTFATMLESLVNIVKYMISILPAYIGICFLVCCVFWESEYYSQVTKSFYSMFALFLGDIVNDSYRYLPPLNYVFANIYVFVHILFFLCVVQNILLSIVTKAYTQKIRGTFDSSINDKSPRKIHGDIAVCLFEVNHSIKYFR